MLHLFRKSDGKRIDSFLDFSFFFSNSKNPINSELRQQLLLVFDKQRRAVFREAFWINERSIEEVAIRTPVSMAEVG